MTHAGGPLRRAILLRHGQTAWNAERRWQGHTDVPLDDVGLRQAERAAQLLARDGSIVRLVTSSAKRAVQTALVVKGALDLAGRPLALERDPRLLEIDMGQWAGLLHDEVLERFADDAAAIERGEDIRRGLTGETLAEAVARVRLGFDDAVAPLRAGESALIVLHGAVMRGLTAGLVGLDAGVSKEKSASIDNCRWIEVTQRAADEWRIERWNAGP